MFSRLMAKWRRSRSAPADRRLPEAVCQPLEGRVLLAHTIFVDVNSPGPTRDGTAWGNAYGDLQLALGAAVSGNTIRVADGTYKPTAGTDRTISFQLKTGVGIYGGYAGYGAADADARDVAANVSVLSGDIGLAGDKNDNSYHVVVGSGTDGTALLDGFTITCGNAIKGSWSTYAGGGIYDVAGCPTIRDCTFSENTASSGGGMYNASSSKPKLVNCTFSGNSAAYGGGIYNSDSLPVLTNCKLIGNSASRCGGGMYNSGSSSTLINCAFSGNLAGQDGGGMFNDGDSSPGLTNCTFSGNSAGQGGAIYNGIYGASPKLTNCVVWDSGDTPICNTSNTPVITYSDIQGGWTGVGNINIDPLFVRSPSPGADDIWGSTDDDYGDLRLSADSPAAEAGNNLAPGLIGIASDLNGRSRFQGIPTTSATGAGAELIVDMGAYEAEPALAANAGEPQIVAQGGSVTLRGRGASDVAGDLQYAWEWTGDGKFDDATGNCPVFSSIGWPVSTVTIGLRVTDAASRSIVSTTTVTVLPVVFHVDDSAAGSNDGTSWNNAFTSLVTALNHAVAGQEIHVAGGIYKPTLATDRSVSFALKNGVALMGGYAGAGAANSDMRDIVRYRTVLSGDIGVAGDNSDNSYHVVVGSGTDGTAALDGFTISAGNASEDAPYDAGGGMFNDSGSPTVSNCTFSRNSADNSGGGMYNSNSSLTLINCAFDENTTAFGNGGAMYNDNSSTHLSGCAFTANRANDQIVVSDAGWYCGGAICNIGSSAHASMTAINCTFTANSTIGTGGGILNMSSALTLANCAFVANRTGSIAFEAGTGGSLLSSDGLLIVTNCTFAFNTTIGLGTFAYIVGSYDAELTTELTNCIFWGNSGSRGNSIWDWLDVSNLTIAYSDVQGGFNGVGNIDTDPLFVRNPSSGRDGKWGTIDDDRGDLRLRSESPCLGAGSNTAVPAGIITDLAGRPRIMGVPDGGRSGAVVDMGAYEAVTVSIGNASVIEGKSGTRTMAFVVSLSAACSDVVWVRYATADGTAVLDSDYLADDRSVTFLPGETRKTIRVVVKGDRTIEPNETIKVNITHAMNAAIADGQGIGTIINDDLAPVPRISVTAVRSAAEIRSGQMATVRFGSVHVGDMVPSRMFRVTNTGTSKLVLGKLSTPDGYHVLDGLVATLGPGESDVFTIKLLTKKAGMHAGLVSFGTNTAGNMFRFAISGTVR